MLFRSMPLLVSLAEWREMKAFLLSLACCVAVLLAISEILLPGWLTRWWETLHPYAHYAGAGPRLIFLFPPGAGWLASAILVIAVLWISWQWRDSDLLFAIGFSVAAFQVDVSFPDLQRGPALACGALVTVAARAETPQSAIHLASGLLMDRAGQRMGIRSRLGLSVVNLLYPGSAARFIAFPMLSVWLLPYAVFLAFLLYALAALPIFGSGRAALPA